MTQRFRELRARLFRQIAESLAEDDMCKSYEGALEVCVDYPDFFEDEHASAEPTGYRIVLHCYLFCNGRHETFRGKTFGEAINNFEAFVNKIETKEEKNEKC